VNPPNLFSYFKNAPRGIFGKKEKIFAWILFFGDLLQLKGSFHLKT
jgi:hypothetical protein